MPNIAYIMKEWEYTFDQVSKENWIKQIETDLRHKPVESTYSEWWQGAPSIPFVHADDVQNEIVRLPDSLFTQPPTIAEWIDAASLSTDAVNQQILDGLQYGAQALILKADVAEKDVLSKWLKDVFTEMISVSVQVPPSVLPTLYRMLEKNRTPVLIRVERNDHASSLSSILEDIKQVPDGLECIRFIYRFPSTGLWDIETTALLKLLLNDLAMWTSHGLLPSAFFNQCILVLEADEAYFKQILQIRVLHLLWQNLKAKFVDDSTENNYQYLECHILPQPTEKPDHFLIRASMSAMAAFLCGTNLLCIHPSSQETSPAFYKRINRNIHHLLDLESGMYKGTDPLSGAYAIDFHCKQVTERIWGMLF